MYTLFITYVITIFLSLFSTIVMSYVSMATPIGPWIGPTLVLCGMLLFKVFVARNYTNQLALAVGAGSIGGIITTAIGFSFPAIYFLDPSLFNQWLSQPLYFSLLLTVFSLCAGGFGIALANSFEHKVMVEENLAFPIGQLIYKMICVQDQVRKAYELMIGFCATILFSVFRVLHWIPAQITLMSQRSFASFTLPLLRLDLDLWPMLLAIGFVTGHVIAVPLLVGALSKIMIVEPINTNFFVSVASSDFILAFCSGMVLSGTIMSFIKLPATLYKAIRKIGSGQSSHLSKGMFTQSTMSDLLQLVFFSCALVLFFIYLQFSFLAILFTIVCIAIASYELVYIAGEIGLAPLGRFATFVMIPAMFLFRLNMVQSIMIATAVELVGGVAADCLFGRKIAQLASIKRSTMQRFQYAGLVISSLALGIVFWLFITSLGLGSDVLFAYKAQSRQLLLQAGAFNFYVLCIGFIFGHLLSYLKINPMLVLGGLLMPLNISLGLIVGGLSALYTKDKERLYPFWSGVFAANSLWMLFKAFV